MLDKLVSLLAPHTCLVCGTEGYLLCPWCKPDAVSALPERCYRCNAVSRDSAVCQKCRKVSPLTHVWVRSDYEGAAKKLIYRLKFARAIATATVIAELMDEAIPDMPKDTVVTYIPTATSRVRLRGYDQSHLLARAIARQRGLKLTPLLIRVGQSRQVGSDRKHRINQAQNNYRVRNGKCNRVEQVLLVDDILTTGATLESAARLLKQSGIKQVSAAVFAKKR
jgi:ComF family protein